MQQLAQSEKVNNFQPPVERPSVEEKKDYIPAINNSHYYGYDFKPTNLGANERRNSAQGFAAKIYSHEVFAKTNVEKKATNNAKKAWKKAVVLKYGSVPKQAPFN
jgi:hypothetical protein